MVHEQEFGQYKDNMHILNSFYIETRYPVEEELYVKEEDAENALGIATKIFEYVCKKVGYSI